ncbi:MAG TPA: sigma-70 family RNA polymerase sigma factor [Terriglobales bacterium]|nr:sigma-70 family RNA polymerase sigma factor [Terriglobales bacterium]
MGSEGQDGGRSRGGTAVAERLTRLFAELYVKSGGEQYGLEAGQFLRILAEVGARYLPPDAGEKEATEFYGSLRVEELALARACAAGSEKAWEVLLTRYREKLYDAARGITRDDASGHELADSLYGDLYASNADGGPRVSKLASYTGRGSLEGWLRTVLAQEYVNRYRKSRRLVSLEEQQEQGTQFEARAQAAAADPDPRIGAATDEALAGLGAEERFILAAYFLDGRTLAEVGRMLGVHESTISRRVEKLASGLKKKILDGLGKRGMSRRQAEEALEADVRDLTVDVRKHLAQEAPAKTFSLKKERE